MTSQSLQTGIRLYKNKRYEAALAAFLSTEGNPTDNAEISYYLGLCYTKLERYDDALLYLEQVVTADSNLLLVYQSRMILAYIYCTTERFRLAEFEVKRLVERGYESPQVYAAYGYIHYMMNNPEKSIEALERALEMDPDNANALNSLGFILAETSGDINRAIASCLKAVKQKPQSYAYLDSLGWAYFKAGRFLEAKNYLRKAMDLSRGNKVVAHHLRELMALEKS